MKKFHRSELIRIPISIELTKSIMLDIVVISMAMNLLPIKVIECTPVSKCKSGILPERVILSACETSPCILKRGGTGHINMTFVPDMDVQTLRTAVYASVMGIKKYHEIDGQNSCEYIYSISNGTKLSCPLRKGQRYEYYTPVAVKSSSPKISASLHFSLKEKNQDVACFETRIKIAD